MPQIRSTLPRRDGGPEGSCVWCEQKTDILAETPGRPDLGRVPLHILCGVAVLRAYEGLLAGRVLGEGTTARLNAYRARLLGEGRTR